MSYLMPTLMGAVAMASLVAGLLFLRYWLKSRDRLFFFFCLAFLVDAPVRFVQATSAFDLDDEAWIYLPRLATFALIALAIADKNRRGRRDG